MKKSLGTELSAQQRLRRIEGRHNPLVKQLRLAFSRAELTESGDCAIEGLRILEEAIRSGLRFSAVFFRESAQDRADRLLPQIGVMSPILVGLDGERRMGKSLGNYIGIAESPYEMMKKFMQVPDAVMSMYY